MEFTAEDGINQNLPNFNFRENWIQIPLKIVPQTEVDINQVLQNFFFFER